MQRELNPQLFGPSEKSESLTHDLDFPALNSDAGSVPVALVHGLERQILDLRKQIQFLESQLKEMQTRIFEFSKVSSARMDRMTDAMARIEQFQFKSVQDLNEKCATLAGRINERRVSEAKMEELIDRHNQMVQNFDTRMKQNQKIMADRETQVLKAMASLEEARAEIARMKKL